MGCTMNICSKVKLSNSCKDISVTEELTVCTYFSDRLLQFSHNQGKGLTDQHCPLYSYTFIFVWLKAVTVLNKQTKTKTILIC